MTDPFKGPNWSDENPTQGLRFVVRQFDAHGRPVPILQQCWSITTIADGKVSNRVEWRDVPLVEE